MYLDSNLNTSSAFKSVLSSQSNPIAKAAWESFSLILSVAGIFIV
jgi:hypothetical protein